MNNVWHLKCFQHKKGKILIILTGKDKRFEEMREERQKRKDRNESEEEEEQGN